MWLRFGERFFGRVDAWRGEFAHTKFVHVWYLPVAPSGSQWVTTAIGDVTSGFPIAPHARSIAGTYLRFYAPIIAVAVAFSAPLVIGLPVAAAFAALWAWSWSWRTLRGADARRRSDYNLLAFGSRCEPAQLHPMHFGKLVTSLAALWPSVGQQRAPEDVAQLGASDARQAVIAYGILRLRAVERRDRKTGALADRILRGQYEAAPSDGPYRSAPSQPAALDRDFAALLSAGRLDFSDVQKPAEPDDDDDDATDGEWDTACGDPACTGILAEDEHCKVCGLDYDAGEAAAAKRVEAARADHARAQAEQRRAYFEWERTQAIKSAKSLIKLGACGFVVVPLLMLLIAAGVFNKAPKQISVKEVAAWNGRDQEVEVTCDHVRDAGMVSYTFFARGGLKGPDSNPCALVACEQDGLVLPVISPTSTRRDTVVRRGHIRPYTNADEGWYGQLPSSPLPLPYYLAPTKPRDSNELLFAGMAMVLLLFGFGKGVRDLRRARRIVVPVS